MADVVRTPMQRPIVGAGTGEATRVETKGAPILAVITFLSLIFPAYFNIGSLSMNPSKVVLLICVPILLIKLFRGDFGPVCAVDYLILAFTSWMTVSIFINHPSLAIQFAGSNSAILLGGYLVGRAAIRDKQSAIGFVKFFGLLVLCSLPFAILESQDGKALIPNFLNSLPGIYSHPDAYHEPRLGLWRSQWAFEHPIHYGLFCSMAFSLYFVGLRLSVGGVKRFFMTAVIMVCCFLSLSSGPLLSTFVQIALIMWHRVTRSIKAKWTLLWSLAILAYIPIELGSNNFGVVAIVQRLSISQSTAWDRKVIFEHGVAQISKTPILGNGFNDWDLPERFGGSIDNYWIFLGVIFGLPALILMASAFITAMVKAGKRDFSTDPFLNDWRRGWIFMMTSVMLTLATVAVWGELYTITMFMMGCGIWLLYTPVSNGTMDAIAAQSDRPPERLHTRQRRETRRSTDAVPFTRFPQKSENDE